MSKQKDNFCTQPVLNLYFSGNSMNNLLSYCGLTDARMRASEKDLPVIVQRLVVCDLCKFIWIDIGISERLKDMVSIIIKMRYLLTERG